MTIICYGDSNTFGFDPRTFLGGRYDPEYRWVDILAVQSGWKVRNNSMNGREIPRREVVFSKSADLLIIMLGTNDLLQGASPEETSCRMKAFLEKLSVGSTQVLLIAPPPMIRGEWVREEALIHNSHRLGMLYRSLAADRNILFADAGEWNIPLSFDGVHITEEGNQIFARNLLNYIKSHLVQ